MPSLAEMSLWRLNSLTALAMISPMSTLDLALVPSLCDWKEMEKWEKLAQLHVELGKGLPAMEALVRLVLHGDFLDNNVLTENTRESCTFFAVVYLF